MTAIDNLNKTFVNGTGWDCERSWHVFDDGRVLTIFEGILDGIPRISVTKTADRFELEFFSDVEDPMTKHIAVRVANSLAENNGVLTNEMISLAKQVTL